MPDFSSKTIIQKLLQAGYELDRIKGSHHIYTRHDGKRIVVPHPKKDLPKGTYYSILKAAGIK